MQRVIIIAIAALLAGSSAVLSQDRRSGDLQSGDGPSGNGKARTGGRTRLPPGFVRIGDIEPGIIEDMRYATARNFTGRRVAGYRAAKCILARPVAEALGRVHRAVARDGLAIKVYDCYRPVRAVSAFMRWVDGAGGSNARLFHPRVPRSATIERGYISAHSSHSLGTAIDLTLVRRDGAASEVTEVAAPRNRDGSCIDAQDRRPFDTSLDMGTSWDCFDILSHTRQNAISATAKANRRLLVSAMAAEGFRNYAREWWHFGMPLRAYQRAWDFPIE